MDIIQMQGDCFPSCMSISCIINSASVRCQVLFQCSSVRCQVSGIVPVSGVRCCSSVPVSGVKVSWCGTHLQLSLVFLPIVLCNSFDINRLYIKFYILSQCDSLLVIIINKDNNYKADDDRLFIVCVTNHYWHQVRWEEFVITSVVCICTDLTFIPFIASPFYLYTVERADTSHFHKLNLSIRRTCHKIIDISGY